MNIMIIPTSISITKKALEIQANQYIRITGQTYIHYGTYFDGELSRMHCRDDAIFILAEDIQILNRPE